MEKEAREELTGLINYLDEAKRYMERAHIYTRTAAEELFLPDEQRSDRDKVLLYEIAVHNSGLFLDGIADVLEEIDGIIETCNTKLEELTTT